ncbi:tRNA (34-2'-O)-methyltransferase regulator WDR6 isoform X1 [Poecilia latipinna]|uniref:tRNA (34-2'-O)-methyltransferase regulator WDR6 n=1 Tax=Poecilia latipinna TaxID=48699 RepID=A0A3B3UWD1_9TELE|nr:PREDICTED: WD repeat-containing protein 6 isoform X1 [Poecilia latipinna]XP_014887889.1 PREDICTED: WD repeat-containing protein 6 isoform X1 [Poecilia latipinna]XP_014887891.1 PREDICTED: WD repeat-containing protein 6 isoform X1 [Poecilia latipinna]
METAALVAPITGLELFQDRFLLTGEGPVLSVYSLLPRPNVGASLTVLQHYRIHGIRVRSRDTVPTQDSTVSEKNSASTSSFYDLAIFGGKAVRLVRLHLECQDVETLRLETLGPLLELRDWALDVRWLSSDKQSLLCVAVAHNGALLLDSTTGSALVQCSCLEGCLLYSALLLVHDSWADTVLVGGTVFNQIIIWKPGRGDEVINAGHKAPIECRLLGHSGVIFSVSYLQENGYLASASDDRSIRVWGVGALGGPGGKCGDPNPTCLRVLYGHQARVFSVRLSGRYAFSGGEDGACLVWDLIEGGKVIQTLKGHRAGGVRSLAVGGGTGDGERWVATGGADGGVRLWKVGDVEEKESLEEKLTDLKFPGPALPKVVCLVGGEEEKTYWSRFLVCTDRGTVCQYSSGSWETIWEGPAEFSSYCVMETVTVLERNAATLVTLCAVGNISGSIQVFPTSSPLSGVRLTGRPGKIHSVIWKKETDNLYLLTSGAEGFICRWCVEVEMTENCSLVLSVEPLPPFLLPLCSKRWLTAAVRLRRDSNKVLWVCGDRRGSLLLFQEGENVELNQTDHEKLGKGSQRKEEEERDSALRPLSCLFGVHGKHGVTSVCEYQGLLYSTGKDGCVRIFRTRREDGEFRLELLRVQRACRGMEWLERVFILESEIKKGEEPENAIGEEPREARFVIAGFHGVHFVVWDPVRQERLMAVACGGGHRSWSLWPSHTGVWPGRGALVFIKQGAVLTSQPPGEMLGCAGDAGRTGGWSLRDGIHGRGIWCVCRLGRIEETGIDSQAARTGSSKSYWEVVVTGGEDTSLAVLAINPVSGIIKVLSVLTDHISGVRTATAITRPQGETLSALVLSAGGRAQIQCNRLLVAWDRQRLAPSCQVIQVASHRLDAQWEKKRNRHKTVKMDPESRYMSIEVLQEETGCVLVALSCSDGALRLFSVNESENQIELLWETFYHQRCVLSVATCSLQDDKGNRSRLLLSAATDGNIAVWRLTESLSVPAQDPSGAAAPPIPCLVIPAHQSGVNSLAVWVEKLGQQEDGCLVTVASGGDDGQLTVSTVRAHHLEDGEPVGSRGFSHTGDDRAAQDNPSNQFQLRLHSQFSIPLAHAASLTALKLLSPGLLVSTSSDQRVCLWRVSSTGISHNGALCSHVADATGLAVWEEEEEEEVDEMMGSDAVLEETVDPVCKTGEEEETTDDLGNPEDRDTSTASCEDRKKTAKVGWILVCGHGFQLLRLRNAGMDAETWQKKK